MSGRLERHEVPRIDPGQAPGGLVLRVNRRGAVVWWEEVYPDLDDTPLLTGMRHAEILRANVPCYGFLFDGDSGECIAFCESRRRRFVWMQRADR